MENIRVDKLEKKLLKKYDNFVVRVESEDKSFNWTLTNGSLTTETIFPIASISKMFTAAIIFTFIDNGLLNLDDRLSKFFDDEKIKGIHIYKNIDYSENITIEELLCHSSGLPDYYLEKSKEYDSYFNDMLKKDSYLEFNQMLERIRYLKAKFINGSGKKAFYSDVNFEILGQIAVSVGKCSLADLFQKYIFDRLNLQDTKTYQDELIKAPVYLKKESIKLPEKALISQLASGGLISTSSDLMVFLRAFFEHKLFDKKHLNGTWKKLQWFPLEYSMATMKCKNPDWMQFIYKTPEIIGHSGSTGSFAYYSKEKKLYITGTTNYINKNPYPLIFTILNNLEI